MTTPSVAETERLLAQFSDVYMEYDGDNAAGLIRLYAKALTGDDSGICPRTKAWHQITTGSCDQCGQNNLN